MTNEKNVFLLIVEGGSDKTALEGPINFYLRLKKLYGVLTCAVYHTDISTHAFGDFDNLMSDSYNVEENIKKCVKAFIDSPIDNPNKYELKNIVAVASLTDLDCCYCKDEDVVFKPFADGDLKKTYPDYANKKLVCNDVTFIRKRNALKVASLGILSTQDIIVIDGYKINYKAFYMSVNLEHALYNDKRQLTDFDKNNLAQEFRSNASNEDNSIFELLQTIPIISHNYHDSWDEKELMKHPFDRFSNIIILIDWLVSICESKMAKEDKENANW